MTESNVHSSEPSEALEHLRSLLEGSRLLALAVLVEGRPFVGQVPFAVWLERGSLLIHVSALARHSKGLGEGASWSGLVSAVSGIETDPFQVPRVSLEGSAHRLEREDDRYGEARELYLERLPSGRLHFSLGDFSLIELAVRKGRLVAGFGRTYNLTAAHLRAL